MFHYSFQKLNLKNNIKGKILIQFNVRNLFNNFQEWHKNKYQLWFNTYLPFFQVQVIQYTYTTIKVTIKMLVLINYYEHIFFILNNLTF